uniref:Uncharacterized protein n=1 Tax=Anguilla anguilla TaxID=7936 RepID=A0A0E9T8N0_ANGAN
MVCSFPRATSLRTSLQCFSMYSRSPRTCSLGGEVDAPAHTAAGMGHDPQPALQNGGHHCHVGAMPQQAAVPQLIMLGKPFCLFVAVYFPYIDNGGPTFICCCLQVLTYYLEFFRAFPK